MFYSIVDLVEQATTQYEGNVAELMIATEYELTGREREEVLRLMTRNLEVMIDSVRLGLDENHSRSGLTGGDAAKLDRYIKSGKTLSDLTVLTAAKNAIAVNEHNAKMGLVCATPTAGSAGCLPAVLTAATQKYPAICSTAKDCCARTSHAISCASERRASSAMNAHSSATWSSGTRCNFFGCTPRARYAADRYDVNI